MPLESFTFSPHIVLQIIGYVIVAVGLYWAVKLDLQATRTKAESAKDRANEAHELAEAAHSKIYEHVVHEHTKRRNSDN